MAFYFNLLFTYCGHLLGFLYQREKIWGGWVFQYFISLKIFPAFLPDFSNFSKKGATVRFLPTIKKLFGYEKLNLSFSFDAFLFPKRAGTFFYPFGVQKKQGL